MTRASELASAGAAAGTVVVADFQSQGRGTHGREWHAQPGTCLMFTLLARPHLEPRDLEHLPAGIAESLAQALSSATGIQAVVKEPNDITVNGKKLCGVLCSSRVTGEHVEWVLCGVGLNTSMSENQLPVETATSLLCEGVDPLPTHEDLLTALLSSLEWLLTTEAGGCASKADKPILSTIGE